MASTKRAAGQVPTTPGDAAPRLASLTMREREALELVALGLTNAEIAQNLFISEGTVRKHLENAFLKLGVHTRTQAAGVLNAARVLPPMPVAPERPRELPRYLTSFVGRGRELERLQELVEQARLLTLTGSGGVGKTRLALHVAEDQSSEFAAGAWFVELASLADPSLVPQAVASELGVREQPGYGVLDSMVHFLRPRRLLVVLDNCEHVLSACADLVDTLLRACPSLQVIVTSRQPLRIDGETVYPVPPLSLPADDQPPLADRLLDSEAVRLFVERATAALPDFRMSDQNAALVAQVSRRLDGIPLAIELAAALMHSRPLELIAKGLDDRFRLLVAGSRTAVPRQQTLRAAVDWSYDLLTAAERTLLRRLSVFAGTFTPDAAESVCAGDYGGLGVIDLLASLVDKSLVILDRGLAGGYRLLETVREYGRERLVESGEEVLLRTRHHDWYLALVEQARQDLFGGPRQAKWLARLEREHDNLRAALEWSRASSHLPDASIHLAGRLWRFWEIRGYPAEGRKWLETALAASRGQMSAMRANALTGAGVLAFMQGDYAASFALHEESLALHRQLGDAPSVAFALSNLGNVAVELEDYERARACHQETADLHKMLGNEPELAGALLHLAEIADRQGDQPTARKRFEETLATLEDLADSTPNPRERAFARWLFGYGLSMYAASALRHGDLLLARRLALRSLFVYRELGDGREGARVLTLIADIASRQEDAGSAASLLLEALATRHAMGDRPGIAATLEHLAMVAASMDPERAVRLLGAADALREQMGTPVPYRDRARHEMLATELRAALGSPRYGKALDVGRHATLPQAVADASALAGQQATPPR
jgi:non-specific serine/threonine protein kinase